MRGVSDNSAMHLPTTRGPGFAAHASRPAARDGWVAALALVALLLWEASGLDRWAAHLFGSAAGFALRDDWLASRVLHDGGRLLGWVVLGAMLLDAAWLTIAGPSRAERLRAIGATLLCLLMVPLLKRASRTSCPWDLVEFGGSASYVPHWMLGSFDAGPGHCFPSGHAVAAFAFFSGYFLFRSTRPAVARTWLAAVLIAGLAYGWGQLARGAHYPSHTLWSAWLCWCACAAVDRLPRSAQRVAVGAT